MGLVVLWHGGSSPIRDWTPVSCIGWRTLYHWAPGKPPLVFLVFASLFLAALGLPCCVWGLLSGCGTQASRCDAFFYCWAPARGCSGVAALLEQGANVCPLHWQAGSLPLNHQGGPEPDVLKRLQFAAVLCAVPSRYRRCLEHGLCLRRLHVRTPAYLSVSSLPPERRSCSSQHLTFPELCCTPPSLLRHLFSALIAFWNSVFHVMRIVPCRKYLRISNIFEATFSEGYI